MKHLIRSILAVSALAMAGVCMAATLDLPTTVVNGNKYYYYTVKQGETLYSISRALGISRDDIVRCNPTSADVLRADSRLLFPMTEFGSEMTFVNHVVKRGETMFRLSHQYGVSVDRIIEANPSAAEGIKAGQTLRIPMSVEAAADREANANTQSTKTSTLDQPRAVDLANKVQKTSPSKSTRPLKPYHIAIEGETMQSIAYEYGIDLATLQSLNPVAAANGINGGDRIRLVSDRQTGPVIDNNPKIPTPVNEPIVQVPVQVIEDDEQVTEPEADDVTETQVIALMLPFMLNEEKQSKNTQMVTDFYRGFLLGVKSVADSGVAPIKILIFDTRNDAARVRQLLTRKDIKESHVIVGPDDETQLAAIAQFAADNGMDVFNILSVKDSLQQTNPSVMQANIATADMYRRAANMALDRFSGYTPVILRNTIGRGDKEPFIETLTRVAQMSGIQPVEVEFNGTLMPAQLDFIDPSGKYVFIPTSGSVAEFNKVSGAIKTARDNAIIPDDIAVLGYPDWTAFRGDAAEMLHTLGAVVFSRFFYNPASDASIDFTRTFADTYGMLPMEVLPNQGQLGYDTAVFLVNMLRTGTDAGSYFQCHRAPERGLQSAFRFSGGNAGTPGGIAGYANDALYVVKYLPIDREVEVTVIAD